MLHIYPGCQCLLREPIMIRTIWPVGQGLFCSERFVNSEGQTSAVVVYDCGSTKKIQWDNIEDKFMPKGYDTIDLLFISHFHADHISGIPYLLGKYHIRKILLPIITTSLLAESYIYNTLYSTGATIANHLLIGFAKHSIGSELVFVSETEDYGPAVEGNNVTASGSIGKSLDNGREIVYEEKWIYIPFNHIESGELEQFEKKLSSIYPSLHHAFANIDNFDENEIQNLINEIGIPRLKELYESCFSDMNSTSMTVYSAPLDVKSKTKAACLYTGDYPMRYNDYFENLMAYYHNYWYTIGTLQVPHHGSDPDNPEEFYDTLKDTTSIICAGKGAAKHPGRQALINLANSRSLIHIVTEEQNSKFFHHIDW